jgi:hypothetical protein
MKRLFLVLTVGLLWSTNAALAAPITQNNKLSISAVSSVFTEIYAIPKADRSKPVLSDNQKIQEQNIAADPAHKRAQVAAQNSAVVKENSYKNTKAISAANPKMSQNSASDLMFFQQTHIFSNGLFYGFILMVVLLNGFCSILFKDKAFGFFALGITALGALIFQFDGLAALFTLNATQSIFAELGTLWLLTVLISVFAHQYLLAQQYAPKLQILSGMLLGLSLVAIGFYAFLGSMLFVQISEVIMVTLLGRYLVLGLLRAKNSGYAKIFVLALTPLLIVLVDQLIYNQIGQSLFGLSDGLLKISTIALVLIMTYGLLYRMQALKGEQDMRNLEMRIFMDRQEAFTARIKTEKLVEDLYLENLIMQYDLDGFEIKLLQYISEGKTNVVIAKKMKTTVEEIEDRTKDLYQKLDIAEQIREDEALLQSQPDYLYN